MCRLLLCGDYGLCCTAAKHIIVLSLSHLFVGVGQIVFCQVTAVKEAGGLCNVTLSADPKSVHKFKYADEMCLNYSLLIPGMMMDALVTEVCAEQ